MLQKAGLKLCEESRKAISIEKPEITDIHRQYVEAGETSNCTMQIPSVQADISLKGQVLRSIR